MLSSELAHRHPLKGLNLQPEFAVQIISPSRLALTASPMKARILRVIKAFGGVFFAPGPRAAAQPQVTRGENGSDLFYDVLGRILIVRHPNLRSGRPAKGSAREWRKVRSAFVALWP